MALKKEFKLKVGDKENGVVGEYHRVSLVAVRSAKKWDEESKAFKKIEELVAVVELYKDKDFRDQDAAPLHVYEKIFEIKLSDLVEKNPKAKAFDLLKALDEFSGAEDV